jgi:hypothetical protein
MFFLELVPRISLLHDPNLEESYFYPIDGERNGRILLDELPSTFGKEEGMPFELQNRRLSSVVKSLLGKVPKHEKC